MSDPLATPHLKLPYLAAAQAQKHVTHNEALRRLDMIVQLAVLNTHLTAPPAAPGEGDRHLVGAGASGVWTGHDGEIARFIDGAWEFAVPQPGWLAFDRASETILVRGAAGWQAPGADLSGGDDLLITAIAFA